MEPAEGDARRDCWTVAFGNSYNSEERIVCSGYDNGDIKMFDLKTMSLRWETNVKNGVDLHYEEADIDITNLHPYRRPPLKVAVCGIEFDRKDIPMNKMIATTLESKFCVFDVRTQHSKKGFAYLTEKVSTFGRAVQFILYII
ncbi:hypothetical protein ANN_23793 [Periplaneta americana]|uniref:Uncharacterized protein n=1 Tax=Periplaneta americana TaxID=6978 RepID=A0ABQ8SN97_PERAM|nr:hypothetical protein ANN_23793 [Periplaneta americana]